MGGNRIAAGCALLALAAGCGGDGGNAKRAAAAATDCPDVPAAPPPPGEIRSDRTMTGQPVKLPAPPAVQAVLSVKCVAAGATIPRHKHPWQRYVYLQSGSLTVTFDLPEPGVRRFAAGDLLVESTDTWHSARAGPDGPARLIVIDQVPATSPPTGNSIPWTEADGMAAPAG